MCGLVGSWGGGATQKREVLEAQCLPRLRSCGPDESRLEHYPAKKLLLGQSRLKILKLTPCGRQPSLPRMATWSYFTMGKSLISASSARDWKAKGKVCVVKRMRGAVAGLPGLSPRPSAPATACGRWLLQFSAIQ